MRLIALLAELDARRLYLGAGCSSLFTYCTQVLRLSEHAAYGRIEAARAARQYPVVLEMLEAGTLNLTSVGLLRQHLTPENHSEVLASAAHRSKREVEEIVARLRPSLEVASSVRRLPQPTQTLGVTAALNVLSVEPLSTADSVRQAAKTDRPTPSLPAKPTTVKPVAPERYRIQMTVSRETHERLRRVQDLLRHALPTVTPPRSLAARCRYFSNIWIAPRLRRRPGPNSQQAVLPNLATFPLLSGGPRAQRVRGRTVLRRG